MKSIKEWVNTHKDKLIAILTLLVSFFTALIALGKEVAIFAVVMIAIIQIIIFYLKEGLTDRFFDLCVSTTKLIVDVINGEYTKTQTVEVAGASNDASTPKKKRVKRCILTEEMIRAIITKNNQELQKEEEVEDD